MTAEKKLVFQELEKLIEQYFEKKPMAAEKLLTHIAKFPKIFQLINYTDIVVTSLDIEDAQQIAYVKLLGTLRQQKFYQGNANDFISWARIIANNAIRDYLRQSKETYISSDWALLRQLSQKRLQESLLNAGLLPDTVENYILACNSFKSIYIPNRSSINQKLSKPDKETWNAIAQLYNQKSKEKISIVGKLVTPETIEKWMRFCVKAVRSYLFPEISSLNQPISKSYDRGEIIDHLVGKIDNSLINHLILKEEFQQHEKLKNQINRVLTTAFENLKNEEKELLELYYIQGLTQNEISRKFNTQQYTVSRKLSRIKKLLLKSLVLWAHEKLHISLTSDSLKSLSTSVEIWLSEQKAFIND